MAKIGFIGLGTMGFPMAGHLIEGGYETSVFNRTTATARRWQGKFGGAVCLTPASLAEEVEILISCVGNDDDLREVTIGELGAFEALQPGSLYIDHSTTSASVARELAVAARKKDIQYIDAPVSGGQAGAENGQLTVMCGAEPAAFDRAQPVIGKYAKACTLMGPVGTGQLTKMVNQICIAGLLQGLAEGLNFAAVAGLDVEKVIAVISDGAAQSWQLDNRGTTMCRGEFDFGFAVDWMRKDLGIVQAEAEANGARLPVTQMVDTFYAQLQSRGDNRQDTSSLIKLLQGVSGR